ncbi:ligase-associated DNA damage response DEXH box helicase [Prosthecobacter sp.]|uniref:ligase-associated DNA damage response DEXH box helicase n=1 Tax=Prosthecobacter sp. TaxID=1965333 RepID=UPI003782EF12
MTRRKITVLNPQSTDAIIPTASRSTAAAQRLWTGWFKGKKWKPFPFQQEAWSAFLAGESGLVHAPTGLGKTYSVWGGPVLEWLAANPDRTKWPRKTEPIRVLWLTPLRALANDTVESLRAPLADLGIPWSVELRTGDTTTAVRQKQRRHFPTALVTTPESLSLLLTHADTQEKFASLRCVIVDEWHELMGTKRGVQAELCLARLRQWAPGLRVWGLSATLGNLTEALHTLLGATAQTAQSRLVSAHVNKKFELKTLLPRSMESFPWSGHAGLRMLPEVIRRVEKSRTTLLFVNTRSQVELWFQSLQAARPDWVETADIALHHGSVDRQQREEVEERLRAGTVKCVVCTGSLDLGVDFSPVEQVIQIGAPKGVARMLQRAGRSGHQPGAVSRIYCVPAHALELVEFAAVRDAIGRGEMEAREPVERPLDLLVQHLVTLALGGGFHEEQTKAEIRSTHAFRDLSDEEWQWVIDFITRGGKSLRAYPQFRRVRQDGDFYTVDQGDIARFHRMSIGTITSDAMMSVRLLRGSHLGSIEESFIARLKEGDGFAFAGFQLEFVRVHDMTAFVRKSKKTARRVPQWMGGKMPLSTQLARAVRLKLAEAKRGTFDSPEMRAAEPVLHIQSAWSLIPEPDELLIEWTHTREGVLYFIYPFAGRLAHEGLAVLTAHRLGKIEPRSFALTMNDYGFALMTPTPLNLDEQTWRETLSPERLVEDILDCLNSTELARRKFREIARIAGLVFQGYPGSSKSTRQVQASSGLFYDMFSRYEPDNRLLDQARREVIERQLEVRRLQEALAHAQTMKLTLRHTERLTPLSFPLWAMWVQAQVTTEKWADRVRRMSEQLEAEARNT